jgi:hypothetical protein
LAAIHDVQTGATLNINSLSAGNETQEAAYLGLQLINTASSAMSLQEVKS